MNNRLWIMTEEYPTPRVLKHLFTYLSNKFPHINVQKSADATWRIIPQVSEGKFTFRYHIDGVSVGNQPVEIQIVSGTSSFVDYLFFWQELEPVPGASDPILLVEVTKTDDQESRNTGINQRGTKFVNARSVYPKSKLLMHFDISVLQKKKKTPTHVFGRKLFATLGVDVTGVEGDNYTPFTSIDEIINAKNAIAVPRNGVPNTVSWQDEDKTGIVISSRLIKNGTLSHDPNIGFVSLLSGAIRALGFKGRITVENHGLPENYLIRHNNKFNHMCVLNDVKVSNVRNEDSPYAGLGVYWQTGSSQEKHASMLAHAISMLAQHEVLYANHGGTERGYYIPVNDSVPVVIPKVLPGTAIKIAIPDVVLLCHDTKTILVGEGKKYTTRKQGVVELDEFDAFETYLQKDFPDHTLTRCLTLMGGGTLSNSEQALLLLQLSEDGTVGLGVNTTPGIKETAKALGFI